MGVNRNDYVMIAVDINDKRIDFYSEENEEKYLPLLEGHKGVEMSIIDDISSGKYCFFGKVLKKADDYDGDGFDREPINIEDLNNISYDVKLAYWNLFNEDIGYDKIKLYCFTQWC